jgi:hypothetical protein
MVLSTKENRTTHASAAMVRCRTDPVFVLSNGDVVSVTLDIQTSAANVRNIIHVLHVPKGVTVRRVAYTALNLRLNELYQLHQDSPAATHSVETRVTTHHPGSIQVTVYGRLDGGIRKSISGFNGQNLFMTLHRP